MRIGATISGLELTLLNRLSRANSAATLNQLRLATEKNINYPRDNPSTFTALSMFQSRLSTVATTMSNVTAASSRVTQAQSTLAQIRTQLEGIRTTLLTDEDQALSAADRTTAQESIDTAVAAISSLASTEIDGRRMLDGSATYDVSGRDSSQVTELVVRSTGGVGQVSPAEKAELEYTGSSRYAAADAMVKFTGDKGSTTLAFYTTDTLEDMAAKINGDTNTTGVAARVDDNTLIIESEGTGSNKSVTVAVQSGTFAVTGGDGAGTDDGVDAVYGSTPAISGTIDRAATQAELVYTGSGSAVTAGDGGTLTITGALGSADVTISDAEALSDVATKINNESHKTGITADASGSTLTFTSVQYGSDATLSVSSDDPDFSTTGGNNDGTAVGTDMIATINGITYSPATVAEVRHRETGSTLTNDATVEVTGHLGSFTFALTDGTDLSTVATTIAAQKDVTGVNATVDGNDLVLTSTITGEEGLVTVNVSAGTFDTVTGYTPPESAQLVYTGVDGKLTADADFDLTGTGTHTFAAGVFSAGDSLQAVADLINDEVATTGVLARVDGDQLFLETVGRGSDSTLSIDNLNGTFDVTGTGIGVDGVASDSGEDASTPMASLDGNRLTVNQNRFHYEIEFADSFSGRFNTMSVSGDALTFALTTDLAVRSTLAIPSLLPENLGGLSGKLTDLLTGGATAGLDSNTAQAIRIVDEALGDLDKIEGSVDGFYDGAIASSSSLLSDLESDIQDAIDDTDGYDENEQILLLAKNQQIMSNITAGLAILTQQRSMIITLIQQAAGLA